MLARTCNSIGKDSVPPKTAHQPQSQQQQPPVADKKDNSTRLIKSTSPGKKSTVGVDGVTTRKDPSSSTLSRQSTAASGRGRSSSSPTSSRVRPCRDGGVATRRGDSSRWAAVSDGGRPPSGAESPASTSRTADSDHDSVDDLRCAAHHRDRPQARQTLSPPYSSSHAPPPSLGLYESLRLQQEAAALQAAVYSPLHQLLAQRHLADPLTMYSASLQAAAVVAAAAAGQANLGHAGRLPGKDYRLGDVPTADLMSNGDVDGTVFGAAGMLPLRPLVPPVAHQQSPFTCSWLTAGGEFCAQRFSTSEELFSHLRTHVERAPTSEDSLRSALPPSASCYATVGGLLCGQSAALPVAGSTFGVGDPAASLAAAHAAASLYRSKVHRPGQSSRETSSVSPTSAAGGSLLLHAAAAAAAASSRYHPYKWTPTPFVASQLAGALGAGGGLPGSDLAPPAPPAISAFLQQPPYVGLFSAQTLGAAVP